MTIKLYTTKDQPYERLFTAFVAGPDTPRGQYDEEIDLAVTKATGYIHRDELRKVAAREMRRRHPGKNSGWTVRRIARVG